MLEPDSKLSKNRLYRESCLQMNHLYIKDLNPLVRHISKTIIVDNAPYSFAYQVFLLMIQIENGIHIKNYLGDKTDNALPELLNFLMKIKNEDDVRTSLKTLGKVIDKEV